MRAAIRLRHYSRRTEESYLLWIRRFILYHGKRHPSEMGAREIAAFLPTWLRSDAAGQAGPVAFAMQGSVLVISVGLVALARREVPSKVPPVFSGSRLLLYGFVDEARPTAARLSARGPDAPLSFEVPLHGAPVTTGRIVATLAARARISELEETSEWLTGHGSQQLERKESLVRREIIEWSLRYGLISRETSFVAVERRRHTRAG